MATSAAARRGGASRAGRWSDLHAVVPETVGGGDGVPADADVHVNSSLDLADR
jgi:hypothetical protein